MESQRVKSLTEGYLRGWLNFRYSLKTSVLREELIIRHIQDAWYYDLVANKSQVYGSILTAAHKISDKGIDTVNNLLHELIELKLPYLLPKDKIKENSTELSKEELNKWKDILTKLNKK